jgi:type I restriction-modification system DNA methylase subunit
MPAPQIILELIERFERNSEAYKSGNYNETQVRREFIDPFFEALGWDVNNKAGNAEAYKDVIHEDAVKVSGVTKAPDYSFRIGGQRKFFVEAKQPSINIKDAPAPAFQVRRYAWSAKLPLSIVTDFEEFAVYDCRIKPDQNDKADKARIIYYTYQQYADKWDEIATVFSKDAILKGSFDKFAESSRAKRGTSEVDNAFLSEIESWREMLARNIALRNTLTVRELNEAVQRTIDRIIFLRIAEDRGIEDYGALRSLCNGNNIYGRLQELFYKADDRYNSGLFHFRHEKDEAEPPDNLTPKLIIDDKPLKDILQRLYYPDSPYEFSVLPADILGQVYEQFLGKVIRLTSDHRAVVEDKPEVKKAGGVFYTPTYIVDYIVKNTVGKLLEDKNPKTVEKLRILDPACGSGSFLLGAYQYLLDWHLKWYSENDPEKHAKAKRPILYKGNGGAWHLTTAERKRILLSNIYGVDIDIQAVEVTKLSLLLKVLEDETDETLNRQRMLFHERALPNLGGNIKCGNSLIGPDFYEGKQMNMLNTEEAQRVNVFDWQTEFSEIFKAGGFDTVIGNPPYGAELSKNEVNYISQHYVAASYQYDTYPLFLEKIYKLAKTKGYCSLIVPSAWVASKYDEKLRHYLAFNTSLDTIVIAPKKTFRDATVETLIIVFLKEYSGKNTFLVERWDQNVPITYRLSQDEIKQSSGYIFPVYSTSSNNKLIKKIIDSKENLSNYADVVWGVKIYQKGKGKPPQEGHESASQCFHSLRKTKHTHKPLLGGSEINRYSLSWSGRYVDYGKWLAEPRASDWFDGQKILVREVTAKGTILATIVEGDFVFSNSVDGIRLKDNKYALQFILGIVNSRLISFYHLNTSANSFKGAFPKLLVKDILNFPLPALNLSNSSDKNCHDRMVQLVEQMLALNKQLPEAKTGHEQTLLQRQIDATDKQIDKLVYELYELTEEEIAIVEGK